MTTPNTPASGADRLIDRLMSSDPEFDDCADAASLIQKQAASIELLHVAICQAVTLLNAAVNPFRVVEANDILRHALVAYADSELANPEAAPVAPAPQTAPMPYPTDAQTDAVYEQTMGQHLRSQDAPAVRRFGRAMFLYAWNAATQAAPAPQPAPLTSSFVQTVPDKCDRIVWRNNYYHLPIAAAPKADHIPYAGKKVAPLQQGEYLPLPGGVFRIDPGSGGSIVGYSADQMHAYAYATCAARRAAQAAPADVAEDAEDGARFRAMVNATFADDEAFERVMHAASETEPETIDDFRALVDKARAQTAQPEGGA